jgi:pimeloyl-ACP methyl ester carboxylesterase
MNLKRLLYLLVIAAIFVAACNAQPTPTPATSSTPTTSGVPRVESTKCWFNGPSGVTVECSYLIVPEDHAKPDGPTLKLAVARFKSDSSTPAPDPIVYLEGGPGGSPLRSYIGQFSTYFGPLLDHRDLILFDQRGTGYSLPALDCPEYNQLVMDTLDQNLSADQSDELANKALLQCHDRLAKEGVNLAVYDSAQNAADIASLQKALGLGNINLYGISYGTRLALTAMRDAPQGIRSVVIDSVFPPQADLYSQIPANGARAAEVLFHTCATDTDCNKAYPNLRDVFFQTVDQLNQQPLTFTMTLHSGEKTAALMNGDSFLGLLFQSLYATEVLPYLPRLIYDVHTGNAAMAGALQADFLSALDKISTGMQDSVQCSEELPFSKLDDLNATLAQYPEYKALASKGIYNLCKAWVAPTTNTNENQPVTSDIPTLIFSGEFDPITPPAWGQETGKTLSKSFFFQLPHAGHGASISQDCPRSMMLAFFDDPTKQPDSACIATKMANTPFAYPIKAADIKLKPFTESTMGFSGEVPDTWQQLGPGVFTPSGQSSDLNALLQQAAPVKPDALLNVLASQLEQAEVKVTFDKVGTRQANGLAWTLYAAQASILGLDVALAERDNVTYIVMLQSLVGDRAALHDAIFLPAIDALKPGK